MTNAIKKQHPEQSNYIQSLRPTFTTKVQAFFGDWNAKGEVELYQYSNAMMAAYENGNAKGVIDSRINLQLKLEEIGYAAERAEKITDMITAESYELAGAESKRELVVQNDNLLGISLIDRVGAFLGYELNEKKVDAANAVNELRLAYQYGKIGTIEEKKTPCKTHSTNSTTTLKWRKQQ